jgi:predicted dehydrogenase
MLTIGIIGYGYWGPNLARNFSSLDQVKLTCLADTRADRLKSAQKLYPDLKLSTDPMEVVNDPELDAIIIAAPANTHYELAKRALLNGKHVLAEKPLGLTSSEASELVYLAEKKKKVLMVDHTFLYTSAVRKMREVVDKGDIGKINYVDSTRINLGLFQSDVNVLWDLAAHDLSILFFLTNERPVSLSATGISHTHNNIENIAYLTLNYQSDLIAHFNCSWSSPVKIRKTLIGGEKKMIVYDDMEPTEKIKIYDTGYDYKTDEDRQKILVDYRVSDIFIPKLDFKEALQSMAEDFVESIIQQREPVSNKTMAMEIVKILEASNASIKNNGKEIYI